MLVSEDKFHEKKILEPSCGTGNFIIKIIDRFINSCYKHKLSKKEIISKLETNIIAFEIDNKLRNFAINRINNYLNDKYNIKYNFENNILLGDSLYLYKKFSEYFDYIIGNPPYVKIQNLEQNTKEYIQKTFKFSKGNTDLYLTFFEISLKMLNEYGKLGFITPNSYFKNSSNKDFRKYIIKEKLLSKLVNFKHYKVFDNFSTYTAITILDKNHKNNYFEYYEYNGQKIVFINKFYYKNIKNEFVFNNNIYINKNNYKLSDYYEFYNGFATLADKIFIKNKNDKILNNLEKEALYPILKASKMKENIIIFPYKIINNTINKFKEEELKKNYPNVYNYFLENKNKLLNRDLRNGTQWFEFGRSQALKQCLKEKIAIAPIIYDKIKYKKLDNKTFVYSGIFAVKKKKDINWNFLIDTLEDKNFFNYLKENGKTMANNYFSISTKLFKKV